MGAMRFLAIACNCSCIAGIPAIPEWNPHGMGAMRFLAIACNCSCIAGIPAIHGHKKTGSHWLPVLVSTRLLA